MKFTRENTLNGANVLANGHYVAVPYDCTELNSLAKDGVIAAGTVIPSNDAGAVGVLLSDVVLTDNPNGAVIIHGFVKADKLPTAPAAAAVTALAGRGVYVLDDKGLPAAGATE